MKIVIERKRMRNLYMRFDQEDLLRITAPLSASDVSIQRFIEHKRSWIEHTQKRVRQNIAIDAEDLRHECLYWFGEPLTFTICKGKVNHAVYADSALRFTLKEQTDEAFRQAFRRLSERMLAGLIHEEREKWDRDICLRHGLRLPSISLRYMVSRWGVCRPDDAHITISTRLIHYPRECLSYILLHEYVHFLVRNHSAAFYKEVAKRMADYEEAQNLLKGEFQ
ncbi:MAG: M48 family metallopeptidase [Bulleidia sp.]